MNTLKKKIIELDNQNLFSAQSLLDARSDCILALALINLAQFYVNLTSIDLHSKFFSQSKRIHQMDPKNEAF